MFRNHVFWLFIFLLFLAISCNSDRIYENNIKIPERIWTIDDPAIFRFDIEDTHIPYNFYFNLRNSILYPYQNIYLNYSLMDTLGNVFRSDLVNIRLFDSRTGEPLGDGLGDIFDHQYLVIEDYSFNNPGSYQMRVTHYMRPDSLPEIMAVGLRIERKNPSP